MKKIFVVASLCAFLTACSLIDGKNGTKKFSILTDSHATTSGKDTTTPIKGTNITGSPIESNTTTDTNNPTKYVHGFNLSVPLDWGQEDALRYLGDGAVVNSSFQLGDKTYAGGDNINLSYLGQGLFILPHITSVNATLGDEQFIRTQQQYLALLQQKYSWANIWYTASAATTDDSGIVMGTLHQDMDESNAHFNGLHSKALPTQGMVTYIGKGYGALKEKGFADNKSTNPHSANPYESMPYSLAPYTLKYEVDFANKTGSGVLDGYSQPLMLDKSSLEKRDGHFNLFGQIKTDENVDKGSYLLGFFGDNAEEIVGQFTTDTEVGVFGGTKQAK